MKPLTLNLPSFPAHRAVIELCVVGRGKAAYLRIGTRRIGESNEIVSGAIDNGSRLRSFLRKALDRMATPEAAK